MPRRWCVPVSCLVACFLPATYVQAAPSASGSRIEFERALAEFDEAQQIQLDRPDGARRLFRQAAQRFSSMIASGIVNGRLEFNLANCHLQSGDVGRAILHYRRAERLIPGDEALTDNLYVARSRCLTSIQPARRGAFLRSVFFWHFQTSVGGRARAAIVLYVAFWGLLAVRNFVRRRSVSVSVFVCGVLACAAGASVGATHWADRNAPAGVVTAMDVVVYKGPGTGYQRQFEQPLQPGVEFTLRQQRGEWWKIELVDGKSGWINVTRAELVPTERPKSLKFGDSFRHAKTVVSVGNVAV